MRVSRDAGFDEKEEWNWYKNKEEEMATLKTFTIIEPQLQIHLETPQNDPEINPEQPDSPEIDAIQVGQPYVEFDEPESAPQTPASTPFSSTSPHMESPSSEIGPRGLRPLTKIYSETENVFLEPGELLMIAADQPLNFKKAVTSKAWQEAMQTELDAIEKNKTWKLTDFPPRHKVIGLKWLFKVKKDNLGKVVKHKARLVAKGFVQKEGVDFDEVFAPVARLDTVRLIIAFAAQHG